MFGIHHLIVGVPNFDLYPDDSILSLFLVNFICSHIFG